MAGYFTFWLSGWIPILFLGAYQSCYICVTLFPLRFLFLIIYVCVFICSSVCLPQRPMWSKELNRCPRAGTTSSYERLNVGAGNQIQVLWKNSTNSYPMSLLCVPHLNKIAMMFSFVFRDCWHHLLWLDLFSTGSCVLKFVSQLMELFVNVRRCGLLEVGFEVQKTMLRPAVYLRLADQI